MQEDTPFHLEVWMLKMQSFLPQRAIRSTLTDARNEGSQSTASNSAAERPTQEEIQDVNGLAWRPQDEKFSQVQEPKPLVPSCCKRLLTL